MNLTSKIAIFAFLVAICFVTMSNGQDSTTTATVGSDGSTFAEKKEQAKEWAKKVGDSVTKSFKDAWSEFGFCHDTN